jgi:Novel STAND NTPase 1
MIRLLRRKRGLSKLPEEQPSSMDLIEPTPPAKDAMSPAVDDRAGVRALVEPSLKVVSAEELDPAELAEDGRDWKNFTLKRNVAEGAEGDGEPILLEVHNTAAASRREDEAKGAAGKKQPPRESAASPKQQTAPEAKTADRDAPKQQGGALLHTVPLRETQLAKIEEESASVPSFNIFANPRIWRHDERNLNYSGEVAKLYRDVFTPTRPKKNYRDFSGRRDMIEAIIQAVEEERSHVVLLGEKSIGKTSLLNIIDGCATEAGYLTARMSGTTDMTFHHFIMAILEQFTARIAESPVKDILQKRLGTDDLRSLVDPQVELDVPAAIKIFQRLSEHQAIVFVDDFDRVENDELKIKIRELMSVASDQGAWLSLMLFGRASRVGDILPECYQSLPNVTWIKLSPMSDEDAIRVIARGISSVGVQFSDEVAESIIRLAQGMPSAIQWLCLLVIRHATQRYASEVEMQDLAEIVASATGKIDARLSAFYDQLCGPTRGSWADDILFLAVRAPSDQNGVFTTEAMSRISQEAVGKSLLELPLHSALSRFTGEEDGGPVLEKVWTSSGTCYRFVNPAMRAIVMLKNCGRLSGMSDALLEGRENVELLPSPDAAPGVA